MLWNKKQNGKESVCLYYQSLFMASFDAIMTLDPPDWQFTSANPATIKMFKAKNEEDFLTYAPWKLSPELQPDGRASIDKAKEMIETAIREDHNKFEWMHKRLNGEIFFAEVLLSRVDLKEKYFILAIVRDISKQKKTEQFIKDKIHEMDVLIDTTLTREEKMIEMKKTIRNLEEKLREK